MEKELVADCLDSTFVSSIGKYVSEFEDDLANYVGAKHAVAVVNGTAALQLALILAGVKVGDEVVVPSISFVATANAVKYIGAHPVFADSENQTLGICPEKLAVWLSKHTVSDHGVCINKNTGRIIKALMPTHVFGNPFKVNELVELALDYNLVMIEDAAEGLGSQYFGRHVGNFGSLGAISFNGNKIISTGGGGAVLTDDDEFAKLARHLSTTAKCPHKWEYYHDMVGYNWRMPNINAALGCAQLRRMPEFIASKRKLAGAYEMALESVQSVHLLREPLGCESNCWLNALVLEEETAGAFEEILTETNALGIMTRPVWTPLHTLPAFEESERTDMTNALALAKRVINIPSSAFFNMKQIILIGGGGHCRSCIDVLECAGTFEIAGIVDTYLDPKTASFGYKLIGSDQQLEGLVATFNYALVSVGHIKDATARVTIFERVKAYGGQLPVTISPFAHISRGVEIGEGTIVLHHALINTAATLGVNCIVNSGALIEHDSVIGDNTHISTRATVNGGVTVGANSFVGSGAVIREGVQIGSNTIIGAGAVVKFDVLDNEIIKG